MEVIPKSVLDFFPLEKPRQSQAVLLKEIQRVFESGKKLVILEAPVGSGKSAIAVTLARLYGKAHILTPRKSLQDQYFEDFSNIEGIDMALMKGRRSYPCVYDESPVESAKVLKFIRKGSIPAPMGLDANCGSGPCKDSTTMLNMCMAKHKACPYTEAIQVAQQSDIIVHNMHSFLYQTHFGEKFELRPFLAIDEAHEIEGVLRGFFTKNITIKKEVPEHRFPKDPDLNLWCDLLLDPEYLPPVTAKEEAAKEFDENFITDQERYINNVEDMRSKNEMYGNNMTVKVSHEKVSEGRTNTVFEFIPHSISKSATSFLLDYGTNVLLMSGTIYDKAFFCKNLGIDPEDAYFIRIPSSFPVKLRPIYAKPSLQVDTSFASWNQNFPEIVEKVTTIMDKFHDVKGLIHTPSYEASMALAPHLPRDRVVFHDNRNLAEVLEMFYSSKEPKVLLSPVCQQGVDFKYDRARFQIITRIPYLNAGDEFVKHKVENDFAWYNYQALVVFGQQIGRVNRAEDDFGATFLLDARFKKFIAKNGGRLPEWLRKAIIY